MDNYILKYGNYKINEGKESIEFPLFISNKLRKILQKIITEPIAKKLLETKNSIDISWIDADPDSKSVSYFPLDRINRITSDAPIETTLELLAKYWPTNPPDDSDLWKSKYRQSMSWGKLINKLFPNEFSNMDIDRFYNRYRPEIDASKGDERFEVVHGDDIRYWYHEDRYNGGLGSCMRHSSCQNYFGIYTNNPDKCGLLIYHDDVKSKLILGRGLVWQGLLKPSGDTQENKEQYTLLDRVYVVSGRPDLENIFHKYAIDHDWIYKKNNESFLMNGVRKTTSVSIRLKPVEYKQYPYMDTMIYYTPATGRAASSPGNPGRDPNNPSKMFQRYTLRSQHGGADAVR
jgi:hypothetical protein